MERLSALDLSNLRVEDRGLPMHVAALVILDDAAPGAGLDLDTVRTVIGQRLHLAPRLRQELYWPRRGLGPPVWVDAAGFDIRDRVRARPVPAPGDETVLLQVCAELNTGRMDRSHPLWQVWLLTGLAGGRAELFIRLHHVVADGIAAVALLGALFDPDPAAPAAAAPAWAPNRSRPHANWPSTNCACRRAPWPGPRPGCGIPQRRRPGSAGWPGKPVSWHATDPPRGCR